MTPALYVIEMSLQMNTTKCVYSMYLMVIQASILNRTIEIDISFHNILNNIIEIGVKHKRFHNMMDDRHRIIFKTNCEGVIYFIEIIHIKV